ncbi:uncharacterized protein LOC133725300 [Rosa rugosa]|uniref:uncharacterized protein LOC133725300 n=1 Tax=Rosa rugosa TaxID=74645 RepID=UPI002B417C7A|nr:uncharacterized protein LOC133725300 [Rosa rugosa]
MLCTSLLAAHRDQEFVCDGKDDSSSGEENTETQQSFVERKHQFPGMELIVREFSFHQLNANFLWPGTFAFAEWLIQNRPLIEGRHCIELASSDLNYRRLDDCKIGAP